MAVNLNDDHFGLAAFKQALKPQEGVFPREVTLLMGPSLKRYNDGKKSDNESLAEGVQRLQNRDGSGRFRESDAKG